MCLHSRCKYSPPWSWLIGNNFMCNWDLQLNFRTENTHDATEGYKLIVLAIKVDFIAVLFSSRYRGHVWSLERRVHQKISNQYWVNSYWKLPSANRDIFLVFADTYATSEDHLLSAILPRSGMIPYHKSVIIAWLWRSTYNNLHYLLFCYQNTVRCVGLWRH